MRRRIGIIVSFLVVCCSMYSMVSAASEASVKIEELEDESADYEEIIDLKDEIINSLKDFIEITRNEDLPDNFEITFKNAKKIYVDTDIFSLATSDQDEIKEELNKSNYMWLLILNYGEDTYQVNIAKGLPLDESAANILSDEEIKKIKENEGKWILSGIELLENRRVDYEQDISKRLEAISYNYDIEDTEIVICGGLQHITQPAALVMKNKKADLLIPLYDLEVKGNDKQLAEVKPYSAGRTDEVYLYDGIKNAVNHMENLEGDVTGNDACIMLKQKSSETIPQIVFTAIIGLALISVVLILAMVKKYKQKM